MRMKTLKYAIKVNKKFLQGVEPNEHYTRTGTAPTMGAKHCYHEYKTVWGEKPVWIEPLTTISYTKILFEEYRWEEKKPIEILLIPKLE